MLKYLCDDTKQKKKGEKTRAAGLELTSSTKHRVIAHVIIHTTLTLYKDFFTLILNPNVIIFRNIVVYIIMKNLVAFFYYLFFLLLLFM